MSNWILDFSTFLVEYVDLKHVKNVLPSKKYKHSKRVAELTKQIKNADSDDIYASAVYHDFLERGGDIKEMEMILTPYALELVKILTNETDEDTLIKLKSLLSGKSQSMIDDILIIKLCDRTDNLTKRIFNNELNKKYYKKTVELLQWIWDNYKGDKKIMEDFIENNIFRYIPRMRIDLDI